MSIRSKIEDKIKKKESDLDKAQIEFDLTMREGRAYIQALQDMIKILPKEDRMSSPEALLKRNSGPRKAYDYLKSVGKPMHITDIMKAVGLEVNKNNRATLASSLNLYVNKDQIFTRPAPATFGLKDMVVEEPGLPEYFGENNKNNEEEIVSNKEVVDLEPF